MNTDYSTLEIEISNQTATIWLNRPEIRNAFNEVMIGELIAHLPLPR
ncbi:MAG: hypothetical protein RBR28_10870 [Lentimicrobium sp.]|jgi:methylglutaconyl-CoA hydratase|nr:hypothetical protein [Lentimicrobium sp.]